VETEIIALFTDGGCILKNPSPFGITWSWAGVDKNDKRIIERCGVQSSSETISRRRKSRCRDGSLMRTRIISDRNLTPAEKQKRYRASHPGLNKEGCAVRNAAVRELISLHKKEFEEILRRLSKEGA
jgi:hypothetical protein